MVHGNHRAQVVPGFDVLAVLILAGNDVPCAHKLECEWRRFCVKCPVVQQSPTEGMAGDWGRGVNKRNSQMQGRRQEMN